MVQECATQWLQSYPCKTKSSQETQKSLVKFLEPTTKPKVIYTGKSLEFGKSREEVSWNHCTSTQHRSETNEIAERAVRRVKQGTSAVLLQSGLDNEWWADSMECCCYLQNVQDKLSDEKTTCERRFGMPFNGPVIPFGAMLEYHTISGKRPVATASVRLKSLPRKFLGYAFYAGGIWKGENWRRWTHQNSTPEGSMQRKCYAAKKWKLHFPGRRWNSQNLWERTASENILLNPGPSGTRRRTRNSSRKFR